MSNIVNFNRLPETRSEMSEDRRNVRKSFPEPALYMEDRRDEATLTRAFSSSFSGYHHNLPKETEDFIASSLTPSENRASREKRKDPFKTPTGTKSSRQKSDPSRFSYTPQHHESVTQAVERNGGSSQRSSSVEGRLEGNPFDDSFERPRQYEFVADVSYAQREKTEEESEVILRRAVIGEKKESTSTSKGVILNRLSSSYDSLESDEMVPEVLLKKQSINSLESCEGRSSTDSLTTTPLPGIYIRSNQSLAKVKRKSLQNQAKEAISRWKEEHSQLENFCPPKPDKEFSFSGPMSLDSSLSAVQYEEDLRKSISVNEVHSGVNELKNHPPVTAKPVTVFRSASIHSSTSSSRGSSARSRKSSIGDELESDSSLPRVSLRKVKREPSLKKTEAESEAESVPEFMRIQLNRVQNKGNAVIFDTEQQQTAKPPSGAHKTASTNVVQVRSEIAEPVLITKSDRQNNYQYAEKPKEQSEIIVEENSLIEVGSNKEFSSSAINDKLSEMGNVVTSVSCTYTSSPPAPFKDVLPKAQNEEQQQHRKKKEEIVLRRPSVVDRAIVIDQTMGALPSSPTPTKDTEEPELFKVFARRSFKMKDPEFEAMMHAGQSNEMDKENHVPSFKSSVDVEQTTTTTTLTKINERSNTSSTTINNAIPTMKNISSKRYSLGSAIPPFVNPVDYKPTVIVLSGNATTTNDDSDTALSLCSKVYSEGQSPQSGISSHPLNDSLSGKSKSQSPHIAQSEISKGEFEGNFSSSSEDNVDVNYKSNSRVKKVNSFSKTGVQNYSSNINKSLGSQPRETSRNPEKDTSNNFVPRDIETVSSSFNSAIIRRSVLATSNVISTSPSESSSTDESHSPVVSSIKPFRGQTVIWPPRNQPSYPSDAVAGSPPRADINRSPGKITSSSFSSTESHSVLNENELRTANEAEPSPPKAISMGSSEPRKQSLKEGSSVLIAEARNTTFSHSFDAHSSPLALSYLGRSETPHKVERKGSAEEGRNNVGGAEDWRVLVRQRREDRMKQTKTPEAEEIILEVSLL